MKAEDPLDSTGPKLGHVACVYVFPDSLYDPEVGKSALEGTEDWQLVNPGVGHFAKKPARSFFVHFGGPPLFVDSLHW